MASWALVGHPSQDLYTHLLLGNTHGRSVTLALSLQVCQRKHLIWRSVWH